jgi:hypothetical protein
VEAVETLIRPPQDDPAKWPSLVLSATVHVLLIGALFLGVQWKSKPPSAVEVEVWPTKPDIPLKEDKKLKDPPKKEEPKVEGGTCQEGGAKDEGGNLRKEEPIGERATQEGRSEGERTKDERTEAGA